MDEEAAAGEEKEAAGEEAAGWEAGGGSAMSRNSLETDQSSPA